jgi:hypothetical protein
MAASTDVIPKTLKGPKGHVWAGREGQQAEPWEPP